MPAAGYTAPHASLPGKITSSDPVPDLMPIRFPTHPCTSREDPPAICTGNSHIFLPMHHQHRHRAPPQRALHIPVRRHQPRPAPRNPDTAGRLAKRSKRPAQHQPFGLNPIRNRRRHSASQRKPPAAQPSPPETRPRDTERAHRIPLRTAAHRPAPYCVRTPSNQTPAKPHLRRQHSLRRYPELHILPIPWQISITDSTARAAGLTSTASSRLRPLATRRPHHLRLKRTPDPRTLRPPQPPVPKHQHARNQRHRSSKQKPVHLPPPSQPLVCQIHPSPQTHVLHQTPCPPTLTR